MEVHGSTLFGFDGNKPVADYPASTFFLVNALSLVGLYREVKCSLLTISILPSN
jgi:hypothetical protein